MIYLLSGPIQSGKTTALQHWIRERTDVEGILTPLINGKRFFREISTGEEYNMEAVPGENLLLEIGRFVFSKKNFDRAILHIQKSLYTPGWLIIDEIGPLELKDQGFHSILEEIAAQRKDKILLVVREGLVNPVTEKYRLSPAGILSPATLTAVIPPGNGHQW